jgi:mono/diheme cytochrome c family protein
MNKQLGLMIAVAAFAGAGLFLWSNSNDGMQPGRQPDATTPLGAAMAKVSLPDSLSEQAEIGERAFNAACAECHGDNATGRQGIGPPLVHKIYEPSHHGDMSFHLAVQNGVRAHHWSFGNMPPQSGLTKSDVSAIVTYVRELQQENGIN